MTFYPLSAYSIPEIVILASALLWSCSDAILQTGPPLAPDGYRNNTALKLAYATGSLKLIDREPPIPEHLTFYSDLEYKDTREKSLKLDIYHLDTLDDVAPLLVFIHGGSWKKGNKDDYRPYLIDYAEKGYVTATVSYRFSQEATFPAAFDDVVCAIKWLKKNAPSYHIDPDKIAVIGGSAGGHLAMMVAYHANDEDYSPECTVIETDASVRAVVNLYGPADLTSDFAINHPSVIQLIGNTYTDSTKIAYEASSPIFFVSPDDPPTLTFHGTIDDIVPIEQSDSLDATLQKQQVPSYYHRLEGWPHTMDLGQKVNLYCQYYMDEFFQKYLH